MTYTTAGIVASKKKVLIVDDDMVIRDVLQYNLEKNGYEALLAANGEEALDLIENTSPDLVVLDIMLPRLDGFELCRIIRKNNDMPIIMLTARSEEVDSILALRLGADDYMVKPFSIKELLSRIRGQLRRVQWQAGSVPADGIPRQEKITADNLEIDLVTYRVSCNGMSIKLPLKEFQLLAFLLKYRGIVFDRETLLANIWGVDYEGSPRTVDIHIRSLRKKIEPDPTTPRYLLTVHGYGYKFVG